jgi:hypothetical protein
VDVPLEVQVDKGRAAVGVSADQPVGATERAAAEVLALLPVCLLAHSVASAPGSLVGPVPATYLA